MKKETEQVFRINTQRESFLVLLFCRFQGLLKECPGVTIGFSLALNRDACSFFILQDEIPILRPYLP